MTPERNETFAISRGGSLRGDDVLARLEVGGGFL